MRALDGLRDPFGLSLAVLAGAVVLALQEGVAVAAACAGAVLAFHVGAGVVATRWRRAPASPPAPANEAPNATTLTAKQLEVAELVAEGLTNREIAARLVVSERTVDNHVFHIMNKLNVHRRTEIGVWVVERRMRQSRTGPRA